jgi:hypothetical protein
MGDEGEGLRILESYGASQPLSPLRSSPTSPSKILRRHSDPQLSQRPGVGSEEPEWPVLFGATPVEEDPLPAARPRSRTLQTLPDGSFPLPVRQKSKPSLLIGQKKNKQPVRRLSLPPILEADQSQEAKSQLSPVRPLVSVASVPTAPVEPSRAGGGTGQSNLYAKYFRWNRTSPATSASAAVNVCDNSAQLPHHAAGGR